MLFPAEAAGDHQVDHDEQVVLELEDQAFARTAQAQHALVCGRFERWVGRAQDERAGQPNALQRLAHDVALEKIQVDRQVRKLGHAAPMIAPGLPRWQVLLWGVGLWIAFADTRALRCRASRDWEASVFSDRVEQADLAKQDPEYIDLLRRVLAIQADCEIGGPHLYVDAMLPSAPSQIDQLVVARTAAEEIDHFRKFARLAGDIGVDTAYIMSRPDQQRYLEAFRGLITTWEDFAVFGFLIDRVGKY